MHNSLTRNHAVRKATKRHLTYLIHHHHRAPPHLDNSSEPAFRQRMPHHLSTIMDILFRTKTDKYLRTFSQSVSFTLQLQFSSVAKVPFIFLPSKVHNVIIP